MTRRLLAADGTEVLAALFEPQEAQPEGTWSCEFQISGLPQAVAETVLGVDGLQAMTIALEGLRVRLTEASLQLTWVHGSGSAEPGDLGIPHFVPSGFGVDVEKRLVDVMNTEMARIVDERRRSRRGTL